MSDDKLRELERRWRASGSLEDAATYLHERLRSGDLTEERVRMASYLGHSPSQMVFSPERSFEKDGRYPGWDFRRFGYQLELRAAVLSCWWLLPIIEEDDPIRMRDEFMQEPPEDDPATFPTDDQLLAWHAVPRKAIEAARACLLDPSEVGAKEASRLGALAGDPFSETNMPDYTDHPLHFLADAISETARLSVWVYENARSELAKPGAEADELGADVEPFCTLRLAEGPYSGLGDFLREVLCPWLVLGEADPFADLSQVPQLQLNQ